MSTESTEITELVKNDDGTNTWTETVVELDRVKVRQVTATDWDVTFTHCYCCSCDFLYENHWDPYCRNHGADQGERPCEIHNMPGEQGEENLMPVSVQEFRKANTDLQSAT